MLRRGQAFLALVFLIGSIITLVGVTFAVLATSSVNTGYRYYFAEQEEASAIAAVQDAILMIDRGGLNSSRNQILNSYGGLYANAYKAATANSLGFSEADLNFNVPASNEIAIIATSSLSTSFSSLQGFTVQKVIKVIMAVDPVTSQATVISWKVLPS